MKPESIRKKVGDIFSKHLERLHLKGYDVFVLIPTDKEFACSFENCTYSVNVRYPYKEIFLYVTKKAIDEWKITSIKKTNSYLLHEAIHVLLWKFSHLAFCRFIRREELENEEEHLTDCIKAILEEKK